MKHPVLREYDYNYVIHSIRRYVFGDATCLRDWEPDVKTVLETVRAWRVQFNGRAAASVGVPDSLIGTYKMAADSGQLPPRDLAVVAFGVLNCLT